MNPTIIVKVKIWYSSGKGWITSDWRIFLRRWHLSCTLKFITCDDGEERHHNCRALVNSNLKVEKLKRIYWESKKLHFT